MSGLNILVVDDDRDFAESLADIFEMNGHRVQIACSGEEATVKFSEQDFNITFMDVRLPGKNGVESYFEIRKLKPSARVVMMTAYAFEQLLDQAVEKGAWKVFHKPLNIKEVLRLLKEIEPHGILIADDDGDFADSLRKVLESAGYRVLVARDGREAIEKIRSNGVDILILDLRMPILNGLETYLELKRMGINLPTIIVTAYAKEEEDSLSRLRSFSVTGVLVKPFNPKELLRLVEREK